ncbi:MAG: HAMP domain-containing sensor histidine kinase [Clostridia bacterium]
MFKKLRRRLALTYTLLTGLVLLAVGMSVLGISEAQLKRATQTAFHSAVDALTYKLQADRTLAGSYLAQSEAGARQVIYVEDAGAPLKFRGAWTPMTDRETLIQGALDRASGLALPLGTLVPVRTTFALEGARGEGYLAAVTLIPSSAATPIKLAVIKDLSELAERIHTQRAQSALIGLGGLAALFVIGWIASGRAVKPAEASHAKQTEFTAVASHELKAPLAVISASAEALKADNSPVLRENIASECRRMARLVDDLLLLARSDAGNWALRDVAVDVDTLLIECYDLYYPVALRKGLNLTLALAQSALGQVTGDGDRLKQALSVLLDNAVSYAAKTITLSGQAGERTIRLTVADDGPGVPEEIKNRLFDRFFRADQAHSDRAHYGLGLSVARELIQMHAGRLTLEESGKAGATFAITLPIRRSPHKRKKSTP